LDPRTRSNVRATLANALRPLLDSKVQHLCRASAAGYVNIAEAVDRGQIVLVSLPSVLHPPLARLIGKSLKADFYKAVFSRGEDPGHRHRLAVLVADEYHLSATVGGGLFDDAAALPLIRGFGAGVVAATQTLANLDYTIGVSARNVLLPNFNTVFFFRTAETETARWASAILGNREEEVEVRVKDRNSELFPSISRERVIVRRVERPNCSLAELSRLEPGQAFVHRQFDPSPAGPVWLAEGE
jgi:type IV secretory pathway TraG/TraD family ATPase VirD4